MRSTAINLSKPTPWNAETLCSMVKFHPWIWPPRMRTLGHAPWVVSKFSGRIELVKFTIKFVATYWDIYAAIHSMTYSCFESSYLCSAITKRNFSRIRIPSTQDKLLDTCIHIPPTPALGWMNKLVRVLYTEPTKKITKHAWNFFASKERERQAFFSMNFLPRVTGLGQLAT